MKSNKIKRFKISMLSSLLAVVLLLVGFSLIMPKATRASAANIYGGISVYLDKIGGVSYLRISAEVNVPGQGDSGNPNANFNLYEYTVNAELNGSIVHTKTFSSTEINFANNYSVPLSYIGAFTEGGNYTLEVIAYYGGDGEATTSTTVNYFFAVMPQTPTKEGYTFKGWYLDEACTNAYAGQEITADMTFYAGWVINTYIVTFNSNGGSAVENQTINWNTVATITTPERVGYNFLGWYNGDTKYEGEAIKADTTLTARWEIKKFTVTFMVDGEQYNSVVVPYGATFEQAMQVAKMGYFNLIVDGVRDGKSGVITENITAVAAAMTDTEKVATFLASNVWLLWAALIAIAGLTITLILVIKKH